MTEVIIKIWDFIKDNLGPIYFLGLILNTLYLGIYKKTEGDPFTVFFMWCILWFIGLPIRLMAKIINYYGK